MIRALLALFLLATPAFAQPNIVLILVDDFSMNLMPSKTDDLTDSMPNLSAMMHDGLTLKNFFVADSLCCPSRASIFTGLLPHNTGVLSNTPPDGGLAAYTAHGDEAKSFAVPLQSAGYRMAFFGKYLNGYLEQSTPMPPGWDEWASTSHGYQGYGYTVNHNGALSTPPDHWTDLISGFGLDFLSAQTGPFFMELASFSPHAPYTPPHRYDGLFDGAVMPKTPAYAAVPDLNAPAWLQAIAPLSAAKKAEFEQDYILRAEASKGVDDMIGAVRQRLADLGLTDSTYVIFTADNGYHMGEYRLRQGKMTPFDTDIHVPFVIVGPGIVAGSKSTALAMNIDLAPTFLDLAGLPASPTMDGHSLVPLLTGGTAPRTLTVVEHTHPVYDPNDPDSTEPAAGDPPSYVAIRRAAAMYVEYDTGEDDYYDLTTDPYELHNVAAGLTPARLAQLHAAVAANAACAGAVQCGAAQNMP